MVIGPCSVKFAPSTDRVSRLILNRHPGESRDPFCSRLGEGSVGSLPSPLSGNRSRPDAKEICLPALATAWTAEYRPAERLTGILDVRQSVYLADRYAA